MSNDYNVEISENKNECFCKSKWFRKFLLTALGSFVGVFFALCLFAALHKPPMMHCPFKYGMMNPPIHYHFTKFDKDYQKSLYNNDMRNNMNQQAPVNTESDD